MGRQVRNRDFRVTGQGGRRDSVGRHIDFNASDAHLPAHRLEAVQMLSARLPIPNRFPPSWATAVRYALLRCGNIFHAAGEFSQLLHRIHIVQRSNTGISDYLIAV